MRKKSDDEFGVLITREMKSMMLDPNISYENRARIMCSILGDEPLEDTMMKAFADSLKVGFVTTNNKRKAEILSRRQRQAAYQKHLRTSTDNLRTSTVDISTVDERTSTETDVIIRASLNKAKQNKASNTIPLNPPSGVEGKIPSAISPEDLIGKKGAGAGLDEAAVVKDWALWLAGELEATDAWGHMRVNRAKLMKCLCSVLKKNGGAALAHETVRKIKGGLLAHAQGWAADDWRYAPGKITDWLYDGKWLEEPRKKEAAAVGSGCGECGVEIG